MHIVWEFSFAATSSIPRIKSVLLGRKKSADTYIFISVRECVRVCVACAPPRLERGD